MARRRFGLDLASVTWDVGASDELTLSRSLTGITAWTAQSGGTQVTDLTDIGGSPLTGGEITSDADGLFGFLGPDTDPETVELWLEAPGATNRQLAMASDTAAKVVDAALMTGGRRIYVQDTEPPYGEGDIWVSTAP